MSRKGFAALAVLTLAVFAFSEFADARRMGGGRSLGAQRSMTPPAATSPAPSTSGAASNPVMPAQPGASMAARPGAARQSSSRFTLLRRSTRA